MRPDLLIVGQGLAGTLLAAACEEAGLAFAIADAGPAEAASRVAAGIINPITGRRLVKSWRVDALLPQARAAYRTREAEWGVSLWRDLRVRRRFADDRERRVFAQKRLSGELAPFAGDADAEGFWIEGAARVDLPLLLATARTRWRTQGRLREEAVRLADELHRHALVVDCSGMAGARSGAFGFVPWEFSKGQVLALAVEDLAPDVVLNCGHWILPIAPGRASVGATHEPGLVDATPTSAARTALEASARSLLGDRAFAVLDHSAGVRVTLPDKRPVAGRHPEEPRLGVLNGLGAKGALLAPWLASAWVRQIVQNVPFDPEVDVRRFLARHSSQALSL
jgi:glycine oxidase